MSQTNQASNTSAESRFSEVPDIQKLQNLRPLGKLEQVSAACHHLGFFNNVGLSAQYRLSASYPIATSLRRLIYNSAADVIRKHRTLFAIPVNEDTAEAYFASLPSIDLNRSIIFLKRSQPLEGAGGGEDKELDAILQDQHNTNFKSEYGTLPFWRLIILQSPGVEHEFTASFIYHHAIGDGVSGLVFHKAFINSLETVSSSVSDDFETAETVVPDDNASLLPPLEELHPLPINTTPPSPPAETVKEWTGNPIFTPCKSRWASLGLSPKASKSFFQECRQKKLSVTSGLSSIVAEVLFNILPPTEEALTCIIPISLRPWLALPREAAESAIGTYFDATRVRFTRREQYLQDSNSTDDWAGARRVSRAINDYLEHKSPSGEPYTTIAILKTLPDVSVIFSSMVGQPRDAAFEVTNVGRFSTPATERDPIWQVGKVLLSRSTVVSGAAVTISVATGGDESMTIGFSWQEGVLEDGVMGNLRKGLGEYFAKHE